MQWSCNHAELNTSGGSTLRANTNTNTNTEDMNMNETAEFYESMTVTELRTLVRDRRIMQGADVLSASKANLIASIVAGAWVTRTQPELPAAPQPTDLAAIIAEHVGGLLQPPPSGLDTEKVSEIVNAAIAAKMTTLQPTIREIEVRRLDRVKINIGIQHAMFPLMLASGEALQNIMLVGPAGSGKSHAGKAMADSFGLKFYFTSVCSQTTLSHLKGFIHANGDYVTTPLREAWQHGGVFLMDEIDAGNPNVLTVINLLASSNMCDFPDAPGGIPKHENFLLIAAANTFGRGADRQYVGRNELDAATRDRFVTINWDYDKALEYTINGAAVPAALAQKEIKCVSRTLDTETRGKITARCMAYRDACDDLQIRHVIGPRASAQSIALQECGVLPKWSDDMAIWKGLDADSVKKIKAKAKAATDGV